MNFDFVKQIVSQIINAIQNSAVAAVQSINKTITGHTYPVEVQNPQKEVAVKGSVIVENPTDLKEVVAKINELESTLSSLREETIKNRIQIPSYPKVPEFPKFPEFPKTTNISNLGEVVDVVNILIRKIASLKLNPEIRVSAPTIPTPIVNVPTQPAPIVNVEAPDLSSIKEMKDFLESLTVNAKKALSVRLTDGKEFYRAIDQLVAVSGSRSVSPFRTLKGDETRAVVDDAGNLKVSVGSVIDGSQKTQIVDSGGIEVVPATASAQLTNEDSNTLLRRIVKLLESNAVVDINNRQRVTVDAVAIGTGGLGVSVTGTSALVASTNWPTNLAPIQQPGTGAWQPVWIGPVDQRFQIMDNARLTYDNGIRSHLVFT